MQPPVSLDSFDQRARQDFLTVVGAFNTDTDDGIGNGTLVLLGPCEPGYWAQVTAAPEFNDGAPDPIDRWSKRVITILATEVGGQAFFPFGKPERPFISWALKGGACHVSPVSLLVHATQGLMVSFRGAVLLPNALPLPPVRRNPCETCRDKPCLTACPSLALTQSGYDLGLCHDYLDTGPGQLCLSQGCSVRRSCPAGGDYDRVSAHSAYHMEQFHPCP